MNARPSITREDILTSLTRALEPIEYVHAMWEGGAIGYGRLDEWSDIDLYVVVDDDKVAEAFSAVEDALMSLSEISLKLDVGLTPQKGVFQAFYRLADVSEHLIIDLAVIQLSSPDKFLEPLTHGRAIFRFNKSEEIRLEPFDATGLQKRLEKRVERLRQKMAMFLPFVQKEINRGNAIEAVENYRVVVLDSLTEMLRIRYHPAHHDFRKRYVHRELPAEVVRRLEALSFIADVDDLRNKLAEASAWFDEVSKEVDGLGLETLVAREKM